MQIVFKIQIRAKLPSALFRHQLAAMDFRKERLNFVQFQRVCTLSDSLGLACPDALPMGCMHRHFYVHVRKAPVWLISQKRNLSTLLAENLGGSCFHILKDGDLGSTFGILELAHYECVVRGPMELSAGHLQQSISACFEARRTSTDRAWPTARPWIRTCYLDCGLRLHVRGKLRSVARRSQSLMSTTT